MTFESPNINFAKRANLVFIDGNHFYDAIKADLYFWYKHTAIGGTIVLDDYENKKWPGVTRAFDEFVADHKIASFRENDLVGFAKTHD